MVDQVFDHLLVGAFFAGSTQDMNCSEGQFARIIEFRKLAGRSLAHRASLRSLGSFVNVPTNGTDKFFLHNAFV